MQSHPHGSASARRPVDRPPRTRVVVTGMGAVTPIGLTVPDFWRGMMACTSGAAPIASFDASGWSTSFACELKGFDPLDHFDRKTAKHMDSFAQYAMVATVEAVADAGLELESLSQERRERIGVIFGSGFGGILTVQENAFNLFSHGVRRVSPFFVPMMIPDMAPGLIAMRFGLHGPNHSVVSACATGNHNIADAMHTIQRGDADVILCGGSESPMCELGVAAFAASRALSTRNDDPATASRPFDAGRDGFVMGEGAGAMVIESLDHALARGARIHAELVAVGTSADAYHMTGPHPEGLGARLAMTRALAFAGLAPEDVDTINMHGTSTKLGDAAESAAIRKLFGAHADRITATSTKSMTGHMLGAAGVAEAIAAVLSIVHQTVPPTINFFERDPDCDLNYAFNAPVERPVRAAMNNAFGFGGHNSSALFVRYDG
jgi:3-oxoacyl-[acyl-carrier-protein] synthase II